MSRPFAPDLAGRIAGLSPAKRQLLERKLQERATEAFPAEPIPRRAERGTAPLSFAQQRLYFLDRLKPGSAAYNVVRAIRIRGVLDVPALERALGELLRRHESLRARFREDGARILAEIAPALPFSLSVIEIRPVAGGKGETEALELAEEEAGRPFDLALGPLFRAKLLRFDAQDHIVVLTMHHIASDAWSVGLVFRELSALYGAFSAGQPSPLPELPIQYGDFAQWQKGWFAGEVLEQQLSYWREQLTGDPATLRLPTDHPRPTLPGSRGTVTSVHFSQELTEALQELSRRESVTLFMTLLAAFEALLSRYTGQEDIVVGIPIANRGRPEIEGLIGFFANTLALRSDLSGNPTFREVLGRVREVALGAYAHQDLPFEKLVEELRPERSLGRNPLFQVMMSFQSAAPGPPALRGLTLDLVPVETKTSKFDLALGVEEKEGSLSCRCEYSIDLFEDTTIQRMLGHFRNLLEGIVADPDRRLSAFDLMSDSERHQVLVEWNQTETEYPRDKTVHGLFEEQAQKAPQSVAVELEGKRLTYGQLNERANRLARYLRKRGVGPEVLVGLCVERSLEMVVGLLGILKAGGAYLPLDPAYPGERLRFMLEDAGAQLVLTQQRLASSVPASAQRVQLDADWAQIARESGENPASQTSPENLAYVIYTSGSTGKPKGVEIEHGSIANHIRCAADRFGLHPGERALQFASLSFDVATQEILATLSGGATLVLRSEGMIDTVATFLARCREWKLTVLHLPTSYWHELVAVSAAEGLRLPESVRLMIVGGEKALPERFAQWHEIAGKRVQFFNAYGPTEATVAATLWEAGPDAAEAASSRVPIGQPISNLRTYVLDGRLRPVPIGVAGELHIGGAGLARGYRNRPDLTAERFIPDPYRGGNERLYRTGDQVRFRPDGILEYLGRVDRQVKVRGFRVEPGEIESALLGIRGVREAVVRAHEDVAGEVRLVAYLVPDSSGPSVSDLRRLLKLALPAHMVPASFVLLDALPKTPSGKLDPSALPAPEFVHPEVGNPYRGPRTPAEETLTEIWMKVLRVERVGVEDNFFELGGHSLLATQVISRIRSAFHVELPLRDLFVNPTIAGLALAIARKQAERVAPDEIERLLAELEPPLTERSEDGQ